MPNDYRCCWSLVVSGDESDKITPQCGHNEI
jgi:hypothetical protein